MSSAEFWELTPRQITLLQQTYIRHDRRWDIRISSLWWRYINAHRKADTKPVPFEEMFPELVRDPFEPVEPEREKTPEEIFYAAKMWALAQPGTVVVSKTTK